MLAIAIAIAAGAVMGLTLAATAMSHFMLTLAIAAGAVMVLTLAAIAYCRGNVPGFLAALYCLLLTVGCVVIFYRDASHSPAASVATQATVSRQRLMDANGRPCATLIPGQRTPIPVREIVCPAGVGADCTATLDVPADQVRALLAPDRSLSVSALVACQ
jgi:hypothetical protein